MTSTARLWRFLTATSVVPGPMRQAILACAVTGCALMTVDRSTAGWATAPMLILQLFSAASGFRALAVRGHYDLLLTSGAGRLAIAVGHLGASIGPGLAGWALLLGTAALVGAPPAQPRTLAVVLCAPALAWALSVPFARQTGAIVLLLGYHGLAAWVPGLAAVDAPTLVGWTAAVVTAAVWWAARLDVPLEHGQ